MCSSLVRISSDPGRYLPRRPHYAELQCHWPTSTTTSRPTITGTSPAAAHAAAVFGISDGLVTNVSLVLGVAGANPGGSIVRLAGIAGLVAGSFSMAAGEYLSMTAQRELQERELEVERRALSDNPRGEAAELRGMYVRRGIEPGVAHEMVNEVMQDPDLALETHAREELGISTQNLGSPWQAAAASFVTFAVGAFIPLAPWLFTSGTLAIMLSVILGGLAAIGVGIVLARFTERLARHLGAPPAGSDGRGRRGDLRRGPGPRHRHQLTVDTQAGSRR